MLAPDVFTLASALGATIEEEVVQTLNRIRSVWDPDKEYETYGFVRQPQTFPDVLLRRKSVQAGRLRHPVLIGLERANLQKTSKQAMMPMSLCDPASGAFLGHFQRTPGLMVRVLSHLLSRWPT